MATTDTVIQCSY